MQIYIRIKDLQTLFRINKNNINSKLIINTLCRMIMNKNKCLFTVGKYLVYFIFLYS